MNRKFWLGLALACTIGTNVWALDDDESYSNYESIVSELKSKANDHKPMHDEPDWASVALHGGLGLTASFVNFELPDGIVSSGLLKGFEAHLGFNMFTREARVEMAFRNFAQDGLSSGVQGSMRELEARVIFLPVLEDRMLLRMGAGLSERFLNLQERMPGNEIHRDFSTPYYSLLLGFERKIAKEVSIGPDFAHHAPLDASSYAKSTWDASFRLNATF